MYIENEGRSWRAWPNVHEAAELWECSEDDMLDYPCGLGGDRNKHS